MVYKTKLPLRLNNLYAKCFPLARITAHVSDADHTYIIRGVLAGEQGSMQAILSHFWNKFVQEVRDVVKLKDYWNPDNKNPERIAEVLERLNFEDTKELRKVIDQLIINVEELQNELRSNGQRRTNPRAPKPTPKSLPSNGKRKRTGSSNPKSAVISNKPQGNEGSGNSEAEAQSEKA